jgi:hypothetical protein
LIKSAVNGKSFFGCLGKSALPNANIFSLERIFFLNRIKKGKDKESSHVQSAVSQNEYAHGIDSLGFCHVQHATPRRKNGLFWSLNLLSTIEKHA